MKNKPLRHCMVVHNSYPVGEPRVQREAEALIDAGYDVDVICLRFPGEPLRDTVYGVNIYRMSLEHRRGRSPVRLFLEYLAFFCLAFVRLSWLHLHRHYNSVQAHNLPDFLVFTALIPRLTGARILLDLHDLMPEFYASRFKGDMNKLPIRLIKLQEHLSCRFAHHVITVTELWRQTLIQRGVPPDKCTVVMNVPDSKLFRDDQALKSLPKHDGFHVLYHGTLAQRYGVDLLLQVLAQVQKDLPGIHMTIHGRGDFLEPLQRLAEELGVNGRIRFSTQYMPIQNLPALIATADIGVVPYRRDVFTDGILPTKLMEYAALGIPAVVVRTPAITTYFDETMVRSFTAENVAELSDCIRALYNDPGLRASLAHNIRQFNQCHNWTSEQVRYLKAVNER